MSVTQPPPSGHDFVYSARRRVALLGDSRLGGTTRISGQRLGYGNFDQDVRTSGKQVHHSSYGFVTWADALLDGALGFQHSDNYGFHNGTTGGVLSRVPDVLATGRYWACIYSAGANDPKPENGPVPIQASMAAMRETWDLLRAAGLTLFIVQDLPRTAEGWRKFGFEGPGLVALHARQAGMRRFVAAYAAAHDRVHVIDPLVAIMGADPSEPLAKVHFDGSHPSPWGAWKVGTLLAQAMRPYLPRRDGLLNDAGDRFDPATNPHGTLLKNGLMLLGPSAATSDPATLPFGWKPDLGGTQTGGTLAFSVIDGLDGLGNAVVVEAHGITVDRAVGVVGMRTRLPITKALAGLTMEALVVVHVDAAPAGLRCVTCRLVAFDSDGEMPRLANAFEDGPAHFWPGETAHRLVMRAPALPAPETDGGAMEVVVLAIFDGAHPGGASFRVSFERASLRVLG